MKTMKTEIDTKEVTVIKSQATKALTYSNSLEVTTDEDYSLALEEGKKIKGILDEVVDRKKEITQPMNESLKRVRSLFEPIEMNLEEALSTIKSKMRRFYQERKEAAEKEKAKLAARVEKGTMKKATAMQKMDEVATPEKTVTSNGAQMTMRTVQKWRVMDKSKIPYEFMEPNMVEIKASFKAGKPVEGVEQYEDSEPAFS